MSLNASLGNPGGPGGTSGSLRNVGYPEAFYAHTHKTPERSNRQKKLPTPSMEPLCALHDSQSTAGSEGVTRQQSVLPGTGTGSRAVGRLRPQQLNLFVNSSSSKVGKTASTGSRAGSVDVGDHGGARGAGGAGGGRGNVGNGYSHIQQQVQRAQQPRQPPATQSHDCHRSVASSTASTGYASAATLAATIPSSHVNIITQAYGNRADIYQDILQIPRDLTSEREIRIAYFRRGRQVLAERPGQAAGKVNSNVSQLAKMRFQAVSMAYEILSNPAWKESYDLYGLHGPDTFQEPAGSASMLADDATLADSQVLAENTPRKNDCGNTGPSIHADNTYNAGDTGNITQSAPIDSDPSRPQYLQRSANPILPPTGLSNPPKSRKEKTRAHISPMPPVFPRSPSPAENNNANNDNASCASQSTAGTNTSKNSNGVLRKTGSFLEKLNKKKASLRKQEEARNNDSARNHNDHHLSTQPQAPTSTVRWNEEVEELIFRQDPDEISFKAGNTTIPVESDRQNSPTDWSNSQKHQHQQRPPLYAQQHQPPQLQQQQPTQLQQQNHNQKRDRQGEQSYEPATPIAAALQELAYPLLQAEAVRQRPEDTFIAARGPGVTPVAPAAIVPWSRALRNEGRDNAVSNSNSGKHRVVLDTAELGSHLEKLDKVADSIADIFDELEASFDGLLGGFTSPKGIPTSDGDGNGRTSPSVFMAPGVEQMQEVGIGLPQQRHPSDPALPPQPRVHTDDIAINEIQGIASGIKVESKVHEVHPASARQQPEWQYEESSFHTPPLPFGGTSRFEQNELAEDTSAGAILAGERELTRLEQMQVEDQAMALLQELAACDSIPLADVVVKTKKPKHHSHLLQSMISELAPLALEGNTIENQSQYTPVFETYSTCPSDMAAGGGDTTVATSVVSLLDPEKHSNAPLKPAATTSTTGAKASRKRLKNAQRRRNQQQRTRDQQQFAINQQQQGDDFFNFSMTASWDPTPQPDDSNLSVRNRTKSWNQLANPTAEATQKPKKSSKKKTEDDYFESLYQNFFALPKERMPTEMTVRMRQANSSCSVSTLSHSVAPTGPESTLKMDVDLWGLSGSWSKPGDANDDKERRSKHNREVMARVDEMLAERSADMTVDSSFPDDNGVDSTFDSGTAVDTSADSTAADTAFTSALDHRKSSNVAAAALASCDVPHAFLNTVFSVPLEAPLEFWCGEMKDSASLNKPSSQKKRLGKHHKAAKNNKPEPAKKAPARVRVQFDDSSSRDGSSESDDDDEPATDESVALRDPPTHDSRIDKCDDSTLNSVNSNNDGESPKTRRGAIDPSASPIQKVKRIARAPSPTGHILSGGSDNEEEASKTRKPFELVKVETASVSQFLQDTSNDDVVSEEEEIEAEVARVTKNKSRGVTDQEAREEHVTPTIDSEASHPVLDTTDSGSTMEVVPDPSSLSGKRIEIDSYAEGQEPVYDDRAADDGLESSASSVSSTVSNERSKSSSLLAYLMNYIKATADNPSLSCIKTNFDFGLESWRASNDACMNAIVISDDDMAGMLDIIKSEMKRHPPSWQHSSE